MGISSNPYNWLRYEHIPTIWNMNRPKSVRTGLPPDAHDSRPIWLLAGVRKQVFSTKRHAEWSIVHADNREQAIRYGQEDYDYGVVYAYLRPEQKPTGDANTLFWNLVDKLDRLAQQGKSDKEIMKDIDIYNPMERDKRKHRKKEDTDDVEDCGF